MSGTMHQMKTNPLVDNTQKFQSYSLAIQKENTLIFRPRYFSSIYHQIYLIRTPELFKLPRSSFFFPKICMTSLITYEGESSRTLSLKGKIRKRLKVIGCTKSKTSQLMFLLPSI
ncbi:hypothetical protein ERO13_D12G051450v2 [Gossypium hirsutum]|uniref:Uncharacterized protein n=5 Tax=Gossypium TaxID=3633 RepID=A0A0D2PPE5_GOSRA|nr:hypothetical protein ES319_D12G056000v1 [Gossypium barbadense]KAG4114548.1 hypothetical protein ERO13_D12G051450v2 [Gossypium hirsutum]KJB48162.1 hypothetical protein B456_008G054700 [Gossypium raimondii]TYG40001.1 hypothetical protein ES288_D12G058600v1 [Gossypium darwinii]TYH37703.1 hypothetical protein ES332_D12G058600v1 [Gossypium tomentosum]TYI49756.1 hypothetical protein E1A91_D12G056600v1 [Gossypium mustelinum]